MVDVKDSFPRFADWYSIYVRYSEFGTTKSHSAHHSTNPTIQSNHTDLSGKMVEISGREKFIPGIANTGNRSSSRRTES